MAYPVLKLARRFAVRLVINLLSEDPTMQCNSCGLHSENLRESSRVVDLGQYRKTIETVHLCAACRVLNVLNRQYIANRMSATHVALGVHCEVSPGALQARAMADVA